MRPSRRPRGPARRRPCVPWAARAVAALTAALVACEPGPRAHPPPHSHAPFVFDVGLVTPDGGFPLPGDPDPSAVWGEPVEQGLTQCGAMRLYVVERRHVAAPPSAPALRPRHFARDERGRYRTLAELLLCELAAMRFVPKPSGEAAQMIMMRGPEIFAFDEDCEWREPYRTERDMDGRHFWSRERCRRAPGAGRTERSVEVFVNNDYTRITVR